MLHNLVSLGLIILAIIIIALITFSVVSRLYFQFIFAQDRRRGDLLKWLDLPLLIFRDKLLGSDVSTSIVLQNISRSPAFKVKIIQLAHYGCWEKAEYYKVMGVSDFVKLDLDVYPKAMCAIFHDIHDAKYVVLVAGEKVSFGLFDNFKDLVSGDVRITKKELEVLDKMEASV